MMVVRHGGVFRIGLGLLAALDLLVGLWALPFPHGFYTAFPLAGHGWVEMLPPYNEHLITDVGELYLGFALVLIVAAVRLEPVMVRTALAGYLLANVPHTVFHLTHEAGMPGGDALTQNIGLFATLALAVALLAASGRPVSRGDRPARAGSASRTPDTRYPGSARNS